jgi:hypothetical protein
MLFTTLRNLANANNHANITGTAEKNADSGCSHNRKCKKLRDFTSLTLAGQTRASAPLRIRSTPCGYMLQLVRSSATRRLTTIR